MKEFYRNYLFNKNMLVHDIEEKEENRVQVLYALAKKFSIKIVKGKELAQRAHIQQAASCLGEYVPEAFYRGFPQSVELLVKKSKQAGVNLLLLDQLLHYEKTYGLGDFSQQGYSLFEETFERLAFTEKCKTKDFEIVTEQEAVEKLRSYVDDILQGTRPLDYTKYSLVSRFLQDYKYEVRYCQCKDTAIRLLVDRRDLRFAKFIALADVPALVDALNYSQYRSKEIKKLNLKNKDRKFIKKVIDEKLVDGNVRDCFEKRAVWNGLLHHIHYRAKTERAQAFLKGMREGENRSVSSTVERAILDGDVKLAADVLLAKKGAGGYLRRLNYLFSRCQTEEDVDYVVRRIPAKNPIVIIQLLIQYRNYKEGMARTFKYVKHNMLVTHTETKKEQEKRLSIIAERTRKVVCEKLYGALAEIYKDTLGKVYIAEGLEKIALPLQEGASMFGYGALAKGTRLNIPETKKIRAFVYWEKTDDINLSVVGLTADGKQEEFSWRTMSKKQGDGIVFSGDQTSGYKGGSEFFDIDLGKFKSKHPSIRFLVFSANVYGSSLFSNCVCRAGYMLRDKADSGRVYEPKTVESAFTVNAESRFAYLFAFDFERNEFVWLNCTSSSGEIVAGNAKLAFLEDYFYVTDVINVASFFKLLASEIVQNVEEADVVVTDETVSLGDTQQQIKSTDFEKLIALLNATKVSA